MGTVHLYFLLCLYARQHLQDPNRASGAPGAEAGSGSAGTTPAPQLFKDSGIFYSKDEPWKFFTPDFYFPLFTLIEFFCYMGWLKVAEALLNPYGDDDQDFDVNFLIDRNLQVSYSMIEEAAMEMNDVQDPFAEIGLAIPAELPYADGNDAKDSLMYRMSTVQH